MEAQPRVEPSAGSVSMGANNGAEVGREEGEIETREDDERRNDEVAPGGRASLPHSPAASDDDDEQSLQTVCPASPSSSSSSRRQRPPVVPRPLELSAQTLLKLQATWRRNSDANLISDEQRDLISAQDSTTRRPEASGESEPVQVVTSASSAPSEQAEERPAISMYGGRGPSPSGSFRYCSSGPSGINYAATGGQPAQGQGRAAAGPARLNYNEMGGFSEAPAKLSFASKRMKQYFESFNGQRGEQRLYQFFKSARTELVACLLFSVILSQTLISSRLNHVGLSPSVQFEPPVQRANQIAALAANQSAVQPLEPSKWRPQANQNDNQAATVAVAAAGRLFDVPPETSNRLQRHLIVGLVSSFSVATLTQVFGPVSGCHLLPSVSLALFFKGHISRARLASYLGAQTAGSLAGVALLGLLTSSLASSPLEQRQALAEALAELERQHSSNAGQHLNSPGQGEQFAQAQANRLMQHHQHHPRQRRSANWAPEAPTAETAGDYQSKKTASGAPGGEAAGGAPSEGRNVANFTMPLVGPLAWGAGREEAHANASSGADANAPAALIQGSESILLSIIEQSERELGARQHRSRVTPPTLGAAGAHQKGLKPKGAIERAEPELLGGAAAAQKSIAKAANADGASKLALGPNGDARAHSPGPPESREAPGRADHQTRPASLNVRQMVAAVAAASSSPGSSASVNSTPPSGADQLEAASQIGGLEIERPPTRALHEEEQREAAIGKADEGTLRAAPSKPKLRRRTRRQQQQLNSTTETTTPANRFEEAPQAAHSNLLQFALPDPIMSSHSVRACLSERLAALAASGRLPNLPANPQEAADGRVAAAATQRLLAELELRHCSGLSNGSQMLIFQLIGTLLVVLAYLVNVDPRRQDAGFKALSIGLAHFLAHLVCLNSAGFYGNPVQLLALLWLASPVAGASPPAWRTEWIVYLVAPLLAGLFGALSHDYIDFTSLRNRNRRLHLRRSFLSLDDLPGSGTGGMGGGGGGGGGEHEFKTKTARQTMIGANPGPAARGGTGRAQMSASSLASSSDGANSTVSSREGSPGAPASSSCLELQAATPTTTNGRQSRNPSAPATIERSLPRCRQRSASPNNSRHSDLLLDSNFLICCAPASSRQRQPMWQQTGPRANGQHKPAAPAAPPLQSARSLGAGATNLGLAGRAGGQFLCTSQFM